MSGTVAYEGRELDALAEAERYYAWIGEQFRPWLRGTVVEVGAGIGTFSRRLRAEPTVERLVLFEPDPVLFETLRQRFDGDEAVTLVPGVFDPEQLPGPVDAIVLVNVLEHIPDDGGFARDAARALGPGGGLLLFVPALPWLYGTLDRAFDHERRYTRGSMRRLLSAAGFAVRRLRYMNLPGIVSWFLAGRVLRLETIEPASVRLYDRCVIPWVSAVERRVPAPLGQNLLAIAEAPASPEAP